jgi:serine/threonine-protein kinase HipA
MSELRVDFRGELLGHLVGDSQAFDFVVDTAAVRRYGLDSLALSAAIPLLPRAPRRARALRQNFFTELLPEGRARTVLADLARLDESDGFGLLRVYGRDVAGALQIWDESDPTEPRSPVALPVDEVAVEQMLQEVSRAPLGNLRSTGKTSLAGVQSKIVLVRTDAGWARAVDGYPSTHIVKPIVGDLPTMIFDEEYGSRFARALGLADFESHLARFGNTAALVIERYDRSPFASDGRLHQEDFSQVLGLHGNQKYEELGGRRLRDVAAFLKSDDLLKLLRMTVLSAAIGNLDMHAKNISLLHLEDGRVRLAPMYDVVPFVHQAGDGRMAFAIDGELDQRLLTRAHLVSEGESWGIRDGETVVNETLDTVLELAISERPEVAAHHNLQYDVQRFTGNLIAGRETANDGDGAFVAHPDGGQANGAWAQPRHPLPSAEGSSL